MDPELITTICRRQGVKSYFITRRVRQRGQSAECCFNDDPGNFVYSSWLNGRATPEQRDQLSELLGRKMEVWADQVEATLGLCYLGERIASLREAFEGDLDYFRTRLEMELRGVIDAAPPLSSTRRPCHQKGSIADEAHEHVDEMLTDPAY